jgi:hypothetical protein
MDKILWGGTIAIAPTIYFALISSLWKTKFRKKGAKKKGSAK